ncbi:hypothetical protein LZ30DRAFT_689948 [Colletotrichum cereale]|nr:hypothetical protein LZ30DRAFT_689948 [Colletotrichum cereale]
MPMGLPIDFDCIFRPGRRWNTVESDRHKDIKVAVGEPKFMSSNSELAAESRYIFLEPSIDLANAYDSTTYTLATRSHGSNVHHIGRVRRLALKMLIFNGNTGKHTNPPKTVNDLTTDDHYVEIALKTIDDSNPPTP